MTEAPAGTWLCPSCSPSAAFYVKQLATKRAASPVVPKIEMTDEAVGSKTRKQEQKPVLETNKEKGVAKKGVAVKKRAETKPKPKWIGWVELSSDGEQEFKKKVNAQWDVEDDLVGKPRRGSRAIIQETELSPRALRARSRPEQQINKRARDEDEDEGEDREAESDESLHQENPQDTPIHQRASSPVNISSNDSEDSEEAPVRRRAPVIYISSNDSNDSEDTMDVDQEPTSIETHSSNEDPARQPETEDTEDPTDMEYEDAMEYQDEEPQANPPAGPEYMDDAHPSSGSIHNPTNALHGREVAGSQSPPPESSLPAIGDEDAMDVRADDDGVQEVLLASNPTVDDFSLRYQRQDNRWGEFHESAIRSTLPRLG